jgi:hypothetical protein
LKRVAAFFCLIGFCQPAMARPGAPLPETVWDGGALSAESLGRGRTIAANMGSPASGSENPAALNDNAQNVSYATTLLRTSSSLEKEETRQADPLRNRNFQYLSLQGEKGAVFYEPLSRYEDTVPTENTPGGTTDVRYEANALGIAGSESWGKGSFGLSMAYLWSTLSTTDHLSGQQDRNRFDTADGLRLNLGVRQPTGPLMWGLVLQNVPAFMWGSDYKRQMLPPTIRVGNTWKAYPGILFSLDWDRRFYAEGGDPKSQLYFGSEIFVGTNLVLRGGVFGADLGDPQRRHVTAGAGFRPHPGLELSYAYETYNVTEQSIRRHYLSLKYPFGSGEESSHQ